VIVAMIPVRVVQKAVDQIVNMVAVRHRFVTAIRAMDVVSRMTRGGMRVGARCGVNC